MGVDAAPVGGLPGLGGAVGRPMIERLESGVLLLRLLRGRRQLRHPAEQRLEEVGRPGRRVPAFGVVAGDEIAAAAARACKSARLACMREICPLTSPHWGGGFEPKNRNLRFSQPSERA